MTLALRVERIGKRYTINEGSAGALSVREHLSRGFGRLLGRKPDPADTLAVAPEEESQKAGQFWAVRDVSFEVEPGERIGIIGANGAGKSTLLKILSRVTAPTEGRVEIRGRVASLLEVGTGFHPELTGRENIFLNGAILGMRRQEIRRKFDQIVDFSGVGRFIDTPVKHYSSGMYVRLAFSVSAWLDPDILIVDEVLAVGDQAFQKKSAERIRELTKEGRTVLFVSHAMSTVNQMCQKALYLEHGRMVSYGPVEETTVEYQRDVLAEVEENDGRWHRPEVVYPDERITLYTERKGEVELLSASVHPEHGVPMEVVPLDVDLHVDIVYRVLRDVAFPLIPNIHLYDEFGGRLFVAMPDRPAPGAVGVHRSTCVIPAYQLNVGRFIIMPAMSSFTETPPVHFAAEAALRFEVSEEGIADPRRHGFSLPLPGYARPRFDWFQA